jgi:hypothetical protein
MISAFLTLWGILILLGLAVLAVFFVGYLAMRILEFPFQLVGFLLDLRELGWRGSSARHFHTAGAWRGAR